MSDMTLTHKNSELTQHSNQQTLEPDEAALYVDGLRKVFGSGEDAITAVDDISFAIEPGQIVGLLGPNGAGKTTTIKSILQLIRPDEGSIYIDGTDVIENPEEAFGKMSMMLEGARNNYWRLTVKENLRYFSTIKGDNQDQAAQRYDRLLNQLDLTEKADEQVRDLSRGMKQKVSLASALASEVSVSFLDEPTLGLDVESALTLQHELIQIVDERDITVILSSHDMDVIENICDRVIILHDGKIIADNDVETLMNQFKKKGYKFIIDSTNQQALSTLRSHYPLTEYEEYGDRVHFNLTAENERFYELLDDIRTSDLTLQEIKTRTPDMEDIFLEIMEA